MRLRALISFIFSAVIISISITSGTGCANIVPPEGGFRDTLPPVLVRSSPPDSTIRFEGNKINFVFDEYIQLDNFQQNVIVSPVPRIQPTTTQKLNTLSLRLRDTLEPNTTYSINFGNSIQDINEGNVMKNFTYVFSTGNTIDSFFLSGNVVLAETGKIDSTLTVILHKRSEDSAVAKERPRYMTRLDGRGRFTFNNLPAGTFYLYALKDETRTLRYLDRKQLFAFADSAIIVEQNVAPKILYAYQAVKAAPTSSTTSTQTQTAADKRLKFQTTISNNEQDLLKQFSFIFERPLRQFDSSKIRFLTDTLYTPATGSHSWTVDSSRKKAVLNYTWQENTLYHLVIEKDFATDTMGYQIPKKDTISFITMKGSDYGKLSIRFRNLDLSKNPVLQFVQSDVVVNSFPLTAQTFSQPLFLPGDYELRVLQDANKNGVWDPGEFFGKHKQPEIVKPVERKVTVRPNWENAVEIAL